MDEQNETKTETPKQEATTPNNDGGVQSSTNPEIQGVKERTAELKAANDAYDAEKARAEKIRAEKIIGGDSLAGTKNLSPEDLKKSEADQIAAEITGAFK